MATLSSLINALGGKTLVGPDRIPVLDSENANLFNWASWTTMSSIFPLLAGRSSGQTIIGGTGVTDTLTIQGTSGNGTATSAALLFKTGNNGNLTAMSILNNGCVGLSMAPNTSRIAIKTAVGQDSATLSSELLTTSGWTVGTGWTESPDDTFAHSSGTTALSHDASIVGGTNYQWSVTITSRTAGSITVAFGGLSYSEIESTYSMDSLTTGSGGFTVTPTTDFDGTCVFSLKSISTDCVPAISVYDTNDANVLQIRSTGTTYNLGIGSGVGENLLTGEYNTAIGYGAGRNLMRGSYNNLFGSNAGSNLTTGEGNTVLGTLSFDKATTASYNVIIGNSAARFLNNGSDLLTRPTNSIYIGTSVRGYAANETNAIVIGYGSLGLGSNTVVIGNSSTTTNALFGNIGLNTTSPSAAIHVVKTTEQLRLAYDGSNLCSFTVGATGTLTVSAPVVFSGAIQAASVKAPPRVYRVEDAATLTPDCDLYDVVEVYNQTTNAITFANPTGTPANGQHLLIRFYGEYTTFAFGDAYVPGVNALYVESTASRQMWMEFEWVARSSKWQQYFRGTSAT